MYYKKSTTPVLSFCLLGRCLPKLLQGYPKSVILPAPSIMEGFLLCNGDETLAIVEPTGATIVVSEAHRNGLHKEPWNNGGGRRSIP